MPKSIMDGFVKKVNLGRRPTPACPPKHPYFKGGLFEKPIQK